MADGGVLVAGSLHLDVVVTAPHLPAADETVMGEEARFVCGGKGGNQAVAASRHGASTAMLGRVGDDMFATVLLQNLERAGVDTTQIQRGEIETSGMSVAVVDAAGEYGAVVVSAANRALSSNDLVLPADTRILLLQNEIPEAVNLDVAAKAKAADAAVILNAAPMRAIAPEFLRLVDILVVNRVEAAALFGARVDTVDDAVAALSGKAPAIDDLIVTLGGEGLVHRNGAGDVRHLATHPVTVASMHGAGDVFVGALAARLAAGAAIGVALAYAQAAAALFVSTPLEGRAALGPADVQRLLGAD